MTYLATMTALQPADSAHALSLMRLRRAAEELIERQADVEFLTLVGELQFDVELWAHIWAPHAALAAHRLGDPDDFAFLRHAVDIGFSQLDVFDGALERAFGTDPRWPDLLGDIRANAPVKPLEIHAWPDPVAHWPLTFYRIAAEREARLRESLPARADSAWDTALRLTAWVSELWTPANTHTDFADALHILDQVQEGGRYDAREFAIVLAQALGAHGIPARRVALRQRDHHFGVGRGYVAAEAWIDDLDAWVLLDAMNGAYWRADNGMPLGVLDLQDRFRRGERPAELVGPQGSLSDDDAAFWWTYLSSTTTTGFGWTLDDTVSPVFQGVGIIGTGRLVSDPTAAYPALSAVSIGLGGDAATPQVSLSCSHPFARAFYVEGDGLDEPLELSVFDAAFTLPMAPGRHELSISVLTSYGRCAPNALVYTVNPTA